MNALQEYLDSRPKACPERLIGKVREPRFADRPFWCARCGFEKVEIRGAACEACHERQKLG